MSVFIGAVRNSFIQWLKESIVQGGQWSNETSDWFTLFRHRDGVYIIVIKDKYHYYKNVNSAAKRLAQLMNRGY